MSATVLRHAAAIHEKSTLERAEAGSDDAFAALVREHQAMVYSIAWNALRDAAMAEEIAQEVFLRLHQSLTRIESEEHLRSWLRRVTTNRVLDEIRKRRFTLVPIDELHETAGEHRLPDPLLIETLRRMVAELPPPQRLAIILRYQEEMGTTEIAEALETPVNTIKSHLRRGLETLRERLTTLTKGRAR